MLDLVLLAMKNFASDPQVQEYACSFMALLIAEGEKLLIECMSSLNVFSQLPWKWRVEWSN